ncbi:Gfo/Idh/MocA family protein [Candidatus Poriferisocius sp.]|uniref:Gfo/Idh/MocA family protein n=1 Tax=Candidatus Poriferisocius sp. TaxID=3101276 RepID=UPI003B024A4E
MTARRRLGLAVVGFGWMGQAHSRSYLRLPTLFEDRAYDPRLVICSDTVDARRHAATTAFGFQEATDDWRPAVEHPDVDAVIVCAPNMLHESLATAAAAAGKHVFCEKPVGGTPSQTARVEKACRQAGIVTGVGYNYRFAPLVLYAQELIRTGELGQITNYRGRFFSMYGSDPMGLLSWRFLIDQAGHGATTDILSHAVDLALMLNGPITRVVGTGETFITERPLPSGEGTHYDRGQPGDPTGTVTNEDYFGALAVFANGSQGVFEASRAIVGPQSQMAFDVYGTKGALSWNHETLNELQVFRGSDPQQGYTTVRASERHPYHGAFVPGDANSIGFEDMVAVQDHEFLTAVAEGQPHSAGMEQALACVSVQAAMLKSWETGAWEDVVSLRID